MERRTCWPHPERRFYTYALLKSLFYLFYCCGHRRTDEQDFGPVRKVASQREGPGFAEGSCVCQTRTCVQSLVATERIRPTFRKSSRDEDSLGLRMEGRKGSD